MASFINFTQVNQHFDKLTTYGGIAPLAQSKWFIGEKDQDPKVQPIDVFIIDNDGNKQILAQPIETDAIGNFINKTDQTPSPIYPQIDQSFYSLLIEIEVEGETITYHWQSVTAEISDDEKYQQKADLIDINNVKPTDDTLHNAPNAKSVIQSFSNVLREPDLSDKIDSTATNVPANSKAVNDLRLSVQSNVFRYKKIISKIERNDLDLSNIAGVIKFILIGGGGGSGCCIHYTGSTSNLFPVPPNTGEQGAMVDCAIDVTNLSTLTYEIGAGGAGGDPSGTKDGLMGSGTQIINLATAMGGAGGRYGRVETSASSTIQLCMAGISFVQRSYLDQDCFGQIGKPPSSGVIRQLTTSSAAQNQLLVDPANGPGSGIDSFQVSGLTTLKFGSGGGTEKLYQSSNLANTSGNSGKQGCLIILSNQEIPDPA